MEKFVDRTKELETLEKEFCREESSFVVVYGRRRVGKTALINHFCKGKNAIYFLATEEGENENRENFKNIVGNHFDNTLLLNASVNRWEDIFSVVQNRENPSERLILVIDEFQYLGKANKSFPSVMMGIWDKILCKSNVMLILCGSLINMMTSQVLNYDSPLYGRRTAQIKLKQIAFKYYHEFDESYSEEQQIERFAVTGGVPKYVELFESDTDIYEAIRKNVLSRNAFLYAEPEFLLQKEVSEIGSYFSILKVIAGGQHKLGKIATALNQPQTSLSKYLSVLTDLDLLERQVPITEENPEKSKMGLYFIKDNFIKFWFQFVYPYRSLLEADRDEFVISKIKQSFIENHVSYVYEDICRKKIWDFLGDKCIFNRVGRWWGNRDIEIDIVAYDSVGTDILFGECKYSKNPKGMDVLEALKEKANSVTWNKEFRKEYFCIFSKNGFSPALEEYAKQHENIILASLKMPQETVEKER